MPRPMMLKDSEIVILSNRVFISRTVRIFTIGQLAAAWELDQSTVYRYISPAYREATRKNAKPYLAAPEACHRCLKAIRGHAKCADCEILIHQGERCGDCSARHEDAMLEQYQELTPCI